MTGFGYNINGFGVGGAVVAAPGQDAYTSAGTFSWVAPAGVTSVSAVAVGTGAKATGNVAGGGGALSYVNDLSTTPGETLTLVIAASVQSSPTNTTIKRSDTTLVSAGSGSAGTGGAVVTGTGGAGGNGGSYRGAGGAGGYSGAGGSGNASVAGAGGAGSGGGGGAGGTYAGGYSGPPGGGGGGVGILGEGSSGAGGAGGISSGTAVPNSSSPTGGGVGGSGGANGETTDGINFSGTLGDGGAYGGGAGGQSNGSQDDNVVGGIGAIRIIWPGDTREFPSTDTGDV